MSHAASDQPAHKPAASHNPLSASEPWNLVTSQEARTFKQEMQEPWFSNVEIHSVTKAFSVGTTAEFWDNMVKGSAPIQMMKKGLGEALWREKEKLALAWLEETLSAMKGLLTSDAWLGGGAK